MVEGVKLSTRKLEHELKLCLYLARRELLRDLQSHPAAGYLNDAARELKLTDESPVGDVWAAYYATVDHAITEIKRVKEMLGQSGNPEQLGELAKQKFQLETSLLESYRSDSFPDADQVKHKALIDQVKDL